MEMYCVVVNTEHGVQVSMMDKRELLDKLTLDGSGDTYWGQRTVCTDIPSNIDEYSDYDKIYVFKASQAKVSQKQVVTKYEVE